MTLKDKSLKTSVVCHGQNYFQDAHLHFSVVRAVDINKWKELIAVERNAIIIIVYRLEISEVGYKSLRCKHMVSTYL